jgi:branched-subunit amino acid transport protein
VSWAAILGLAACTYAMKAVGPLLLGERPLPPRWSAVLGLVAVPMFAALILVQTVTSGRDVVVDSRLAGVAVAVVLVWRRAPFPLVVLAAAASSAAVHALGS